MIAIIDYGVGNLESIRNMLLKGGHAATITSDHQEILSADRLILPGVGSFDYGMSNLVSSGLLPLLNHLVLVERRPILGICLGMQLMGLSSEEGSLPGIGWIDAKVKRFDFSGADPVLKVPHMGWNTLERLRPDPIIDVTLEDERYYFVHSYYVDCMNREDVVCRTEYGFAFDSVLRKDNILGVQFHPEKSHRYGMRLLSNFAEHSL